MPYMNNPHFVFAVRAFCVFEDDRVVKCVIHIEPLAAKWVQIFELFRIDRWIGPQIVLIEDKRYFYSNSSSDIVSTKLIGQVHGEIKLFHYISIFFLIYSIYVNVIIKQRSKELPKITIMMQ